MIAAGAKLDLSNMHESEYRHLKENPDYLLMYHSLLNAKPEKASEKDSIALLDELTKDDWIFDKKKILSLIKKGAISEDFEHLVAQGKRSKMHDYKLDDLFLRPAVCGQGEIIEAMIKAGMTPSDDSLQAYLHNVTSEERSEFGDLRGIKDEAKRDQIVRKTLTAFVKAGASLANKPRTEMREERERLKGTKYFKMYQELYQAEQDSARDSLNLKNIRNQRMKQAG